ncbi:Twisted gastrulation protein-like protein 1 [Aix galericulata]|nr:Twisted gastrulation protein-like protein 1 [Aix galericulata]
MEKHNGDRPRKTSLAATSSIFLLQTSTKKQSKVKFKKKITVFELCQCRPGEGNCSCCKECMLCLGTLWDECCDCVGMCNPRNYSDTPPTSKSTVEELHEPIPSLFRALTEGDTQLNWNIVSFPVAEELSHHENLVSFLETINQPQHQNVSVPSNNVHAPYSSDKEHMCTVVYFDDCMSIHQCKISCESMGASKYRWFHNACCECIGPECIDYGSKTVKCMNSADNAHSSELRASRDCRFKWSSSQAMIPDAFGCYPSNLPLFCCQE